MIDDIKKTLWATADKLRANMDAAEYKNLVLGLIFIKYISDSFEAHKTSLTQRLRDPDDELYYGDACEEDIAAELEDRDYFTATGGTPVWTATPAGFMAHRPQAKPTTLGCNTSCTTSSPPAGRALSWLMAR